MSIDTFPDPRTEPIKGYWDCIFCGHRVIAGTETKIVHPASPTLVGHGDCVSAQFQNATDQQAFERIKAHALSAMHDIALGRRIPVPVNAPGLGVGLG